DDTEDRLEEILPLEEENTTDMQQSDGRSINENERKKMVLEISVDDEVDIAQMRTARMEEREEDRDELIGLQELERERKRRVTEEMIREARSLKRQTEQRLRIRGNLLSTLYPRKCMMCATKNPRQRAVYTHCGHIVCYPCAVDNERNASTGGNCVFCRSIHRDSRGFIKLFEEECGNTKKNGVTVENRSNIDLEAQPMNAKDEKSSSINPSSTRYSRQCAVCTIDHPILRAVYVKCGHVICYPCAVENARSLSTGGNCVICRSKEGFIKLYKK
ncbi:hypothetical protein PENTCL1PPCAC_11085, partial [Pristionchus entomophagus]